MILPAPGNVSGFGCQAASGPRADGYAGHAVIGSDFSAAKAAATDDR